jgi:hypothetical protein
MHDLAFDAIHDELVVSSPFAQAVLTFRGGAEGQEPPIRVIQGPHTQIVSERGLDKVAIDPVNNEIYVATSLDQILVFPREANGDVPPIRVLGGPDTGFSGRPTMRVDPARNLLLVTGSGFGDEKMLIFDRTASGNAKPRAAILGPAGNQFEIYNGLVIAVRNDSVYAWSLNDTGENVRPVMKILTPLGARAAQTGIVLDPAHKEVIIGTGAGNQVRTFSIPELFDWRTDASQLR